jgi:hypothetical protein
VGQLGFYYLPDNIVKYYVKALTTFRIHFVFDVGSSRLVVMSFNFFGMGLRGRIVAWRPKITSGFEGPWPNDLPNPSK